MTSKRIGFRVRNVYKIKKSRILAIAKQKLSFFVASMSLFAFVIGNMVGQHGWYAFWKTVLGAEDDSGIIFVGTVAPVEKVPDYTKWAMYGGGNTDHMYRQVPKDLLVPLPAYDPTKLRDRLGDNLLETVYSVGNLGDYESGADHGGSHVGVDIRVPLGTPVLSIANGIVEQISMQEYGYGHYVVIRHPNVPDPRQPGKTTTLHSVYAHMDTILAVRGQIVHKGEQIGTSGKTGFASGPHLHFQIDLASAPFHPYWPFTTAEATAAKLTFSQAINKGLHQERGEEYTISPLLFTERYQSFAQSTMLKTGTTGVVAQTAATKPLTQKEKMKIASQERAKTRLARIGRARPIETTKVAVGGAAPAPALSSSSSSVSSSSMSLSVSSSESFAASSSSTASSEPIVAPPVAPPRGIERLEIRHSGTLSRMWQKVQIFAVDQGGTTVKKPSFGGKIYVRPEFGEAEIRPNELSEKDFVNGVATVNILVRGDKTVFIVTRGAFMATSEALVAER